MTPSSNATHRPGLPHISLCSPAHVLFFTPHIIPEELQLRDNTSAPHPRIHRDIFQDGSAGTGPGRGLKFQPLQRDSDCISQQTDRWTPSSGVCLGTTAWSRITTNTPAQSQTVVEPLPRAGSRQRAGRRSRLLTISPSRTTFSPLTTKMPRGMSPYFLPTWMRSTVWCNTKFAAAVKRERERK